MKRLSFWSSSTPISASPSGVAGAMATARTEESRGCCQRIPKSGGAFSRLSKRGPGARRPSRRSGILCSRISRLSEAKNSLGTPPTNPFRSRRKREPTNRRSKGISSRCATNTRAWIPYFLRKSGIRGRVSGPSVLTARRTTWSFPNFSSTDCSTCSSLMQLPHQVVQKTRRTTRPR